jgi:hypothetical protein
MKKQVFVAVPSKITVSQNNELIFASNADLTKIVKFIQKKNEE